MRRRRARALALVLLTLTASAQQILTGAARTLTGPAPLRLPASAPLRLPGSALQTLAASALLILPGSALLRLPASAPPRLPGSALLRLTGSARSAPKILTGSASTETFTGPVIGVTDGDTISVLRAGRREVVRLRGIDAPERRQAYGERAKQHAAALAFGKVVAVEAAGRDRHGRLLAEVRLPDGRSLNQELVRAGLAWWFRRYSTDPTLGRLEAEARAARAGLWADRLPVPPWEWRRMTPKAGRSRIWDRMRPAAGSHSSEARRRPDGKRRCHTGRLTPLFWGDPARSSTRSSPAGRLWPTWYSRPLSRMCARTRRSCSSR
jgi:micrococcal nuclease